jgi:probable rRNA maturation factor
MAVRSKAKLEFSCTASKAAAKKYPKWKEYISFLKMASHEVMLTELLEITDMKLGIVLLSDEELLEMNKSVLKHDYYTDILTFEIERKDTNLEAELYFSLDRAEENALRYKVSLRNELARLAIHGMLHLGGYDDKTSIEKKKMRKLEQEFLVMVGAGL